MCDLKVAPILFILFTFAYAGHVAVSNSPSSLEFQEKTQNVLRLSELSDVIGAAMGYTTKNTLWDGLTVKTPFKMPTKAVVVSIPTHNSELHFSQVSYTLIEDSSVQEVYEDLKDKVHSTAQRTVYFNMSEIADVAELGEVSATSLDANNNVDRDFLLEVSALRALLAKKEQTAEQDFLFYELNSYARLVNVYGDASDQVAEAKALLTSSLSAINADNLLVLTVTLDAGEAPHRRSLLLTGMEKTVGHVILAGTYDDNFAAIFNIILWLTILLVIAIYAVTAAMATMDPGRDSIIYRMTNPRIKKDN